MRPVLLVVGGIMLRRSCPHPSSARRAPAPPPAFPPRYGSSLKYSKFRPHSGLRLMFTAGPNSMQTHPPRWHSSPSARPIRSSSASSKLAAVAHAGREAHRLDAVVDAQMVRLTWSCLRSPCGPSDTITPGMPSRSIALQMPEIRARTQPGLFLQRHLRHKLVYIAFQKNTSSHFSVRPQPGRTALLYSA